jgi:putative DNA primase/helicase
MKLSTIFERLGGAEDYKPGEWLARCPAHADSSPSLWLSLHENGKLGVSCRANCATGDVLKAARLGWGDIQNVDAEGVETAPSAAAAPVDAGKVAALRMWLDGLVDLDATEAAEQYATHRFGLSADQFARLELAAYAPTGGNPDFVSDTFARYPRLVVPFFGFDGMARGAQGRDLSGRCPVRWVSLSNSGGTWSKYGVLRNDSGFDTWVITEGPSDGLTAWAQGYNVVMVRGAGMARNVSLIREIAAGLGDADVVLAGDRDKAGEAFTEELAKALVREGVMVRRLEGIPAGLDLTDWRAEGPEEFAGAFHAAVRRAVLVRADEPEPKVERTQDRNSAPGAPLPLTDLGNAQRLFNRLGGHVRMVPGAGVFKWQGKKWEQVPTEALYADVRAVIRSMGEESGHSNPDAHSKWVQRSQDAQKVRGMVDMLSSIPGVYATVDQFDANAEQIAFRNGMVNLRTGEITEHNPADMNTFFVGVDYKPEARAPRWDQFIRECHPESDAMGGFLQELVGYGLSGLSVERCFVMHVGPTTNGKTTFTATLEDVFGAAAHRVDASLFQRRRESGGPRADVVGLRGKRLVISSEWPAHMPLDQALMKSVTGDQTISARGVYARNEITFKPSCLVQVDTNYVPEVDATDAALWQRVRVVPWEQDFRGREDRHLQSTLKREREGIAAWAVAGAVRWFAKYAAGQGLDFPTSVERRTAHYRDASHPLSGFIGEEYEVSEGSFVNKPDAWNRYREWVDECGIKHPMTRNKFYDAVRTFPGVMEGAGSGPHKGKKGFRNLRDVREPAPAGPGIFSGE